MFVIGLITGIIVSFIALIGIPLLWLKVQHLQGQSVVKFGQKLVEQNAQDALLIADLTEKVNNYKNDLENGTGVN